MFLVPAEHLQLRYHAPGEWAKLLGMDRAPEVRTLRIKLKHLAEQERAFLWSAKLCKERDDGGAGRGGRPPRPWPCSRLSR
jgi:hypothetical protein